MERREINVDERLEKIMTAREKLRRKKEKLDEKINLLQTKLKICTDRDFYLKKAQNFYYTRHYYDENVGKTREVNELNKELLHLKQH